MRTPLLHALGRTHCPACMCCVGVVIVGQVSDRQSRSVVCHVSQTSRTPALMRVATMLIHPGANDAHAMDFLRVSLS